MLLAYSQRAAKDNLSKEKNQTNITKENCLWPLRYPQVGIVKADRNDCASGAIICSAFCSAYVSFHNIFIPWLSFFYPDLVKAE